MRREADKVSPGADGFTIAGVGPRLCRHAAAATLAN